jgi:hypothetical protein
MLLVGVMLLSIKMATEPNMALCTNIMNVVGGKLDLEMLRGHYVAK